MDGSAWDKSTILYPVISAYLHIPFCASSCDFCAFYQEQPERAEIDRYLGSMESEMFNFKQSKPVDTVFWGGGTPGLLPAGDLLRLGKAMVAQLGKPPEWSVELAPSSVRADKLAALREVGVTRVSMGIQSFDEATLEALGRRHSVRQVRDAWELVRAAGFESINLDLIFAVPGQDEARWEADLREAMLLGPDHLSTYCLTFEEDTAMFVKLSKGKVRIDRDLETRLYRRTWELLAEGGYAQYEISNFARPGHECRHNLATWEMHDWVGFGPSAASQHAGRRWSNVADLRKWREGVASGIPAIENVVALSPALLLCDALVFGLRMNRGVEPEVLAKRFGTEVPQAFGALADKLAEEGLATWEAGRLALTDEGRLVADAVGLEVMDCLGE
jgi:oxygen-independent coproporphyrinogen-3 oxidase